MHGNMVFSTHCILGTPQQSGGFLVCSVKGKVNMIKTHFCHNTFDVTYAIFKTFCMPIYGSQLWDYGNTYIARFFGERPYVIFLICLTHNELVPYICDDVKPLIQLLHRVISFIKGVSNAKN